MKLCWLRSKLSQLLIKCLILWLKVFNWLRCIALCMHCNDNASAYRKVACACCYCCSSYAHFSLSTFRLSFDRLSRHIVLPSRVKAKQFKTRCTRRDLKRFTLTRLVFLSNCWLHPDTRSTCAASSRSLTSKGGFRKYLTQELVSWFSNINTETLKTAVYVVEKSWSVYLPSLVSCWVNYREGRYITCIHNFSLQTLMDVRRAADVPIANPVKHTYWKQTLIAWFCPILTSL